ncbi:unnamed protein product [Blepharisma stoltei]|uniref:Sm protein B n=1 Tax=Blepharisma stoltei TaxID=1481888 RepID=A0AAU9IVU6_9CILI|nr:unnamed protein product [Blepharisma stoltei]
MVKKGGKMIQWINYRVRVTLTDGRQMVGNFLAFDKHMNAVLSDTEEFRKVKPKRSGELEKEQKRMLGMILIRGENIVSITAEAPPPPQARKPGEGLVIGRAKPVEKGIVGGTFDKAPPGLAGPSVLGGPPPPPVSVMLNAPGRAPPSRPPPPAFNP